MALRMHVSEVKISYQFTGHAVLGLQETKEVRTCTAEASKSKANRLNKKGTVTVDSIYCKRLSLAERLISKVSIGGGACWTRDAVATEELEIPRL
jgi:hypothetical protein